MNRRSLTQAISVEAPEVKEFLKAGIPVPKTPPAKQPEQEDALPSSLEPVTALSPREESLPVKLESKSKNAGLMPEDREEASVPVTFRLPERLVRGMISASAERKIRRIKPSTQQDMAALAIEEWLRKNAYL